MIKLKKTRILLYYNVYAPHKIIRYWIGHLIYKWANNKYGEKARGQVSGNFSQKQEKMFKKWSYYMNIKNKIIWRRTLLDRLIEKILQD